MERNEKENEERIKEKEKKNSVKGKYIISNGFKITLIWLSLLIIYLNLSF